ncbi:chorismate mutase [uncultured Rhodoferax sp.]|uniref:chorismate mutase n=1 Tax=uncultured Rhodoferax sp. TaxID=223188 RepID=UPI0025EB8D12|nr:chorismate mutase [uncultured Rhodoferax sp.]
MSSSHPPAELLQLRTRINDIDAQILALLAQRFEVTAEVGALKARSGLTAVDPAREESQRIRYANLAARHGLSEELVQGVFQAVIAEVVSRHKVAAGQPR